jgi:hypothetical protein
MGSLLIVSFIVLIAPLSYFFGVDSRRLDDSGWLSQRR